MRIKARACVLAPYKAQHVPAARSYLAPNSISAKVKRTPFLERDFKELAPVTVGLASLKSTGQAGRLDPGKSWCCSRG